MAVYSNYGMDESVELAMELSDCHLCSQVGYRQVKVEIPPFREVEYNDQNVVLSDQ